MFAHSLATFGDGKGHKLAFLVCFFIVGVGDVARRTVQAQNAVLLSHLCHSRRWEAGRGGDSDQWLVIAAKDCGRETARAKRQPFSLGELRLKRGCA